MELGSLTNEVGVYWSLPELQQHLTWSGGMSSFRSNHYLEACELEIQKLKKSKLKQCLIGSNVMDLRVQFWVFSIRWFEKVLNWWTKERPWNHGNSRNQKLIPQAMSMFNSRTRNGGRSDGNCISKLQVRWRGDWLVRLALKC